MSESDNTLALPQFDVKLANQDPFSVTVTNGCQIQWDLERGKNGWGPMEENTSLWAGYVAYVAARREGKVDRAMPWSAWLDVVETVTFKDTADAEPFPGGDEGEAGDSVGDSD